MIHLWSARNGSNFPTSVHPDYITIDQHLWMLKLQKFPRIQHPTLQIKAQDPSRAAGRSWQVEAGERNSGVEDFCFWSLPSGSLRYSNMSGWKIHENTPFIGDFPMETPISIGFPIATFDYRRVQTTGIRDHGRRHSGLADLGSPDLRNNASEINRHYLLCFAIISPLCMYKS